LITTSFVIAAREFFSSLKIYNFTIHPYIFLVKH